MKGQRIVLVGEGMLELSAGKGGGWQLGYGGDTLNTAVHMARMGLPVAYASALGSDVLSKTLRPQWEAEGLDCSLLLEDPARSTGLYAITLDTTGERSFAYWRSDSAARQMFALPESAAMAAALADAAVIGFSLITLAILPEEGRRRLLQVAEAARSSGALVMFDGNYRPRLWSSANEAAQWRDRAIAVASIGLPTLEDEVALGLPAQAEAVAAHWQALGCAETVVKLGAQGCLLPDGTLVPPPQVLQPVDTSGAGDAFNAGYLAARLADASVREAALRGHELAGWCVMRPGAIPPRDGAAPYA